MGFVRSRAFLLVATIIVTDIVLGTLYHHLTDSRTQALQGHRRTYDEAVVRSDVFGYGFRPQVSLTAFWVSGEPYPFATNALGLKARDTGPVAQKAPRGRVVFLGDSFTEGVQYAYEDTFVGRAHAAWEQACGLDVLNAAVHGYAPAAYFWKAKWLIEGMGVAMDRLVVFIDISDIWDEVNHYGADADGALTTNATFIGRAREGDAYVVSDGAGAPAKTMPLPVAPPSRDAASPAVDEPFRWKTVRRFIKRNSLILQAFSPVTTAIRLRFNDERRLGLNYPGGLHIAHWTLAAQDFEAYGATGLASAAGYMDRLATLTNRHGIDLAVAVYPWPDQLYHGDRDSRQSSFWRDWAGRHGATFVDLFDAFFAYGDDPVATIEALYIPQDVHFSRAGHAFVAERFLDAYPSPCEDGSVAGNR